MSDYKLPDWCCASGCRGCEEFRKWSESQTQKPTRQEQQKRMHRARYQHRKEHEQCVNCGAGLQEDDGLFCVECEAKHKEAKSRYNRKPAYRKRVNAAIKARLDAGLCEHCNSPRDLKSARMCTAHMLRHEEYREKYEEKRRALKAGVTPIASAVDRVEPSKTEIRTYRPLDEQVTAPRVRILTTLAWNDWLSASELLAILNVDETNRKQRSAERNAYQQMLVRLAKLGLVEKRRQQKGSWTDYRITSKGREEVAGYRRGDFGRKRAA